MKTDLLISNPPYGAIGANITNTLIQKIDYEEFINLLPANDYKRNETKDLFKYQSNMVAINDGFIDAAVTTHVARIHKGTVEDPAPNINMTLDEFERSQYIDRQLDKYFSIHAIKTGELSYTTNTPMSIINTLDITKTIIIGAKDVNHKHLPYSKTCVQYRWNVLEDIDAAWIEANYSCINSGKTGQTSLFVIYCNNAIEKKHIVELLYDHNGFRFFCKLWRSINVDSYCMPNKYLPKVDWTRSWTVEEILKDYGYTEDEIKTVMADLDNFKGMDD